MGRLWISRRGPWQLHSKLKGSDFEMHPLAPVLRPVVLEAVLDTIGMKGTLMWSLPDGAPLWDCAVCLGTAGCKDQEWVTSRVYRLHTTI